ncbi:RNA polymerase sigma factor RpoD, partial [Vibrio cholerae]|nr:RNA polymerase sigma factor RpoD [Vibrio cholerae]
LISGFVDPDADDTAAPTATHIGSELSETQLEEEDEEDLEDDEESDDDSDDSEEDVGIDPELALEKFNQLRSTYQNLQLAINEYGYDSPKATVANEMMLD